VTLKQLRVNLGWSMWQLAENAGISRATVLRAEKAERPISAGNAKKLADALSTGYNRTILVTEIDNLIIE